MDNFVFPYVTMGIMHATPLLALPSKSPDLHAEAQQFKPHSGRKFFLHTYTQFFAQEHAFTCTRTLVCMCLYICVCMRVVPYASSTPTHSPLHRVSLLTRVPMACNL